MGAVQPLHAVQTAGDEPHPRGNRETNLERSHSTHVNPPLQQFVSQIYVVPKKDGTHRLVINLKALNKFIKCQHFKMEGTQMILQKEDWIVTVDLKDAYLSIPITTA